MSRTVAGEAGTSARCERSQPISWTGGAGLLGDRCQLLVTLDDLRISVYTAEPGTEDAERLDPAIVVGTRSLTR